MREKTSFLIMAVILMTAFSLGPSCSKKEGKKQVVKQGKIAQKKSSIKAVYCPLCGEQLAKGTDSQRPVAVMVENLKNVRPQCGLDQACIVVEALAEGGITRLMAVYANKDVARIGPVRSARNHFVAIARGMEAVFAHCGGSKFAMQAIRAWGVADLDQMRQADVFWRTKEKAPHNLWTSTYKIRSAAKVAGYNDDVEIQGFEFKSDAESPERPEKQNVVIDYSSKAYKVEYQYIREKNRYRRLNGEVTQTDRLSGQELEAKNIIVVFAPTSGIAGGGEVLDVQVVGKNKCLIFRDGKVFEGTWEKTDERAPFHLYDAKRMEIPLNRGQTWIELAKTNTRVTYGGSEVKSKGSE